MTEKKKKNLHGFHHYQYTSQYLSVNYKYQFALFMHWYNCHQTRRWNTVHITAVGRNSNQNQEPPTKSKGSRQHSQG